MTYKRCYRDARIMTTIKLLSQLVVIAYGVKLSYKPWRNELYITTPGGGTLEAIYVDESDNPHSIIRRVLSSATMWDYWVEEQKARFYAQWKR